MFSKLSKTFSFFSLMKRVVLTSTQALWMQHFNALLEYRPEAGAQLSSLLSLQPWSVKTCTEGCWPTGHALRSGGEAGRVRVPVRVVASLRRAKPQPLGTGPAHRQQGATTSRGHMGQSHGRGRQGKSRKLQAQQEVT